MCFHVIIVPFFAFPTFFSLSFCFRALFVACCAWVHFLDVWNYHIFGLYQWDILLFKKKKKNISGKGTQNGIHFLSIWTHSLITIRSPKRTTSRTQNSCENVNKESCSALEAASSISLCKLIKVERKYNNKYDNKLVSVITASNTMVFFSARFFSLTFRNYIKFFCMVVFPRRVTPLIGRHFNEKCAPKKKR